MSCRRFCSVRVDISCAVTVDPNLLVVLRVVDHSVSTNDCRMPVPRTSYIPFLKRVASFVYTGNIRNLAMEKVASTIMFPCKYSSSGCSLSLLHTEKVEHEEMCEWRPYTCPCPGASCKWQGGLEQVMAHLMMSHKSITTLQGNYTKRVLVSSIWTLVFTPVRVEKL